MPEPGFRALWSLPGAPLRGAEVRPVPKCTGERIRIVIPEGRGNCRYGKTGVLKKLLSKFESCFVDELLQILSLFLQAPPKRALVDREQACYRLDRDTIVRVIEKSWIDTGLRKGTLRTDSRFAEECRDGKDRANSNISRQAHRQRLHRRRFRFKSLLHWAAPIL